MDNQNPTAQPGDSPAESGENKAVSRLEMESLIGRYLSDIEVIKGKIREQMSMFNDTFDNDKEFAEHTQKVKDASKLKNGVKQRILKQDAVAAAADKIKLLRSELKSLNEALSDYLGEYQRSSNLSQIVLPNGDTMQIVHVTRLRKIRKDE